MVRSRVFILVLCGFALAIQAAAKSTQNHREHESEPQSNDNIGSRVCKTTFAEVKDGIMLIRTDKGAGSGFLLCEEGKKYLVTNFHVIEDAKKVAAFFHGGERLALGQLFIDSKNDLARFEVQTDKEGFYRSNGEPEIGEEIFIYGDTQGAGVLTEIKGRIIGVGPVDIETDAQFIQGNSGSALLNSRMEVVGVATYMTIRRDKWNAGTRFGDVRRFAVRLDCAEWEPTSLRNLAKRREEKATDAYMAEIFPQSENVGFQAKIYMDVSMRQGPFASEYVLHNNNLVYVRRKTGGTVGTIKIKIDDSPCRPVLLVSYIIDPKRYDKGDPRFFEGFELRTFLYDLEKGTCVGVSHWEKWDGTRTIAAEQDHYVSAERLSMQGGRTLSEYIVGFQKDYILFPFEACYYRLEVWCAGGVVASKEGTCNNATKPMHCPADWFVAAHNTTANPMHRLGFAKVRFDSGMENGDWPVKFK